MRELSIGIITSNDPLIKQYCDQNLAYYIEHKLIAQGYFRQPYERPRISIHAINFKVIDHDHSENVTNLDLINEVLERPGIKSYLQEVEHNILAQDIQFFCSTPEHSSRALGEKLAYNSPELDKRYLSPSKLLAEWLNHEEILTVRSLGSRFEPIEADFFGKLQNHGITVEISGRESYFNNLLSGNLMYCSKSNFLEYNMSDFCTLPNNVFLPSYGESSMKLVAELLNEIDMSQPDRPVYLFDLKSWCILHAGIMRWCEETGEQRPDTIIQPGCIGEFALGTKEFKAICTDELYFKLIAAKIADTACKYQEQDRSFRTNFAKFIKDPANRYYGTPLNGSQVGWKKAHYNTWR